MTKSARTVRHAFRALVERWGTFHCVEVPRAVSVALDRRGPIPVVVTVGARMLPSTLMPSGGGRHRLMLNGEMRKHVEVRAGRRVALAVAFDPVSRDRATPPEVARALAHEDALGAFEALPRGRRNQLLAWIDAAVHDETRQKRVVRAAQQAMARQERLAERASG
ncbi:MAG: hypothetical protein NVSMB47_15140 [Polyangiales bacterium]